jgi:hypothetical protein
MLGSVGVDLGEDGVQQHFSSFSWFDSTV